MVFVLLAALVITASTGGVEFPRHHQRTVGRWCFADGDSPGDGPLIGYGARSSRLFILGFESFGALALALYVVLGCLFTSLQRRVVLTSACGSPTSLRISPGGTVSPSYQSHTAGVDNSLAGSSTSARPGFTLGRPDTHCARQYATTSTPCVEEQRNCGYQSRRDYEPITLHCRRSPVLTCPEVLCNVRRLETSSMIRSGRRTLAG